MMATKVAFWSVVRFWGNVPIAKFRFNERCKADELAESFSGIERCYVKFLKEPVTEQLCQIVNISVDTRQISGLYTDKITGDTRRWRKRFHDVTVQAVATETGHKTVDTFVAHLIKGELRVVGYKTLILFYEMVSKRWPNDVAQVRRILDDLSSLS